MNLMTTLFILNILPIGAIPAYLIAKTQKFARPSADLRAATLCVLRTAEPAEATAGLDPDQGPLLVFETHYRTQHEKEEIGICSIDPPYSPQRYVLQSS